MQFTYTKDPIAMKTQLRNFNMKYFASILLISCLIANAQSEMTIEPPDRGFISAKPARNWQNALISGNGTMGAMVMGKTHDETIILNHALLYMPTWKPVQPVNMSKNLDKIRGMMMDGNFSDAAEYVFDMALEDGYGGLRWTDPFVPAFDIRLKMKSILETEDYLRSVDFQTGTATVAWNEEDGKYVRRLFVSRPDNVVVLSIKGPGKGKLDCEIEFKMRPMPAGGMEDEEEEETSGGIKDTVISADEDWLTYMSSYALRWEGSLQGYEGVGRIITSGGKKTVEGNRVIVKDADEVLLLARVEPSWNISESKISQMKEDLAKLPASFDTLQKRHAEIHGEYFNRMKLDLSDKDIRSTPTETLLDEAQKEVHPAFLEKVFDAARYNVISSSGLRFPNLQGIWGGTWNPPWSGDFTQNGNVPTAIASYLYANMPELMMGYFNYIESMVPEFRVNAKRLFGCDGIILPSRTSAHGLNTHFNEEYCHLFWTGGAA